MLRIFFPTRRQTDLEEIRADVNAARKKVKELISEIDRRAHILECKKRGEIVDDGN